MRSTPATTGNCGRYGLDFAVELLNGKRQEAEATDFSWPAKAVEQWTRFGTPCGLWLPVTNSINILLAAGAEVVPLGRVRYLDVETGEPHPHPGASALFVLRDKKLHQRTAQEERANQLLAELRGGE